MKTQSRYPLLACALALALVSWTPVQARPAIQVPNFPGPHQPGTVAPAMTEAQKIQALIAAIEHLQGAVFIRNGTEYDSNAAAAHLRRKLDYAGKRVKTADQFISALATGSSMTGKPYRIRFSDGHSVDSAVFFREQLRKLNSIAKTAKG
ncbi:MAG: DUF5329 domain-containing protein [Arenimonas sp.]